MFKTVLFSLILFSLTSCTVYTEKQSQALSKSAYAAKDSLVHGRYDLADQYVDQVVRIVKPPKKKIEITPLLEDSQEVALTDKLGSSVEIKTKRIIVVPERFKNDPVVAVNTKEYDRLLLDQKVYKQLQIDYQNLNKNKQEVDEELAKQEKYQNQMIVDLNRMQKQLVEKDLAILKRNVLIVLLICVMGGATYLRIKGIL